MTKIMAGGNFVSTHSYIGLTSGPSTGLDPATTAWINAVVGAGGTVSMARRTVVNTLIAGLKTDGVFGSLDRLWIFAAENTQSATIDMKSLQTASPQNSPTFTVDRGYAGDGISSYIDTGFNTNSSGVNYSVNSATFFAYDRNGLGIIDPGLIGVTDTGNVTSTMMGKDGQTAADINDNSLQNVLTGTAGLIAVNRSGASANQVYQNGSSIASGSDPSRGLPNVGNMFICAANNNGGGAGFFFTDQFAAVGLGGSLSSTGHSSLYTRIQSYMTSVGANV